MNISTDLNKQLSKVESKPIISNADDYVRLANELHGFVLENRDFFLGKDVKSLKALEGKYEKLSEICDAEMRDLEDVVAGYTLNHESQLKPIPHDLKPEEKSRLQKTKEKVQNFIRKKETVLYKYFDAHLKFNLVVSEIKTMIRDKELMEKLENGTFI